jgi:hypothetical protein
LFAFSVKEPLLVESPDAEDSSSNDESLDPDANAEVEEKVEEVKLENTEEQRRPLEEKHGEEEEEEEEEDEEEEEEEEENDMEIQKIDENETPEQAQFGDRSGEELDRQTKLRIVDKSGVGVRIDTRKEDVLTRHETKTAELQQQKHKVFQLFVFGMTASFSFILPPTHVATLLLLQKY